MKAILMSIKARHNRNIESGAKTSELRTKPPKIALPFKVYTYESGFDGRHKVVNEWICRDITDWRICMGIPAHLPLRACVEPWEIKEYSGKDYKDISEMRISDLKIYDTPKELGEFFTACHKLDGDRCDDCPHLRVELCHYLYGDDIDVWCGVDNKKPITRPPQSWCYVEELSE